MYKKIIFIFLMLYSANLLCQEEVDIEEEQETYEAIEDVVEPVVDYDEEYEKDYTEFYNDTITYNKTLDFDRKRTFNDLKSKYNDAAFKYKEEQEKVKKKSNNKIGTTFLTNFMSFFVTILPYLLGVIVVFILVKSFVKTDANFWKFSKSTKKASKKLVYEDDENIDENDYNTLLSNAIKNKDYRLATRYYYLSLLKKLAKKELIQYHKDKTNTEYQFELNNKQQRSNFAYLAYIYDYVWYGEFPVDELKFNTIEKKFKSFIQSV